MMPLTYPVLTMKDDVILHCEDEQYLTRCTAWALRDGYFTNLELVDSSEKLYRVVGARKKGRGGTLRWHDILLNREIHADLDLEIEPQPSILNYVRETVLRSFEHEHIWKSRGDYAELLEAVRSASSIGELIYLFGPDYAHGIQYNERTP